MIYPRTSRLPVAFLIAALAAFLAPLQIAHGCGVVIAREGDAQVDQERALIRWDGRTEDLVMEFSLQSGSSEAAWIVPVPARADVRLAHPLLFDTLQTLTRPRVERQRVFSMTAASTGGGLQGSTAGGGVALLERQMLGPFDVSTLAARDATALQDWLQTHAYTVPSGLAAALQPYLDRGWLYVAVRLSPGTGAAALNGKLDPLWVSFASDQIVYPLRMAGLAGRPLSVFLYVLADHRVALPPAYNSTIQGGSALWVPYANWVEPAALGAGSPLADVVTRRLFLTKFVGYLYPEQMRDDWVLPLDTTDETFHAVEIEYVYTDPSPYVFGCFLLVVVIAITGAVVTTGQGIANRRRIRRLMGVGKR